MPDLVVESLDVFYGDAQVLSDVSIYVREKEVVSVIGPNGAGKTTLLKTISGLVRPSRGSVRYGDIELTGLEPHRIVEIGIVHVPEGRRVFRDLTVYENLMLGAYTRRARERFRENLERVYTLFPVLRERARQKAGTLSGGEQQMLAIARALMSEPRVLLIDEPSLGLAPKIVDTIFGYIERLREEGVTILLAEQNAVKALEVSDRVYVLEIGRVVKTGLSLELVDDPEIKRAYLGV